MIGGMSVGCNSSADALVRTADGRRWLFGVRDLSRTDELKLAF